MLFSSLSFLFLFFPLCLLIYFIIPKKQIKVKNIILLVFSLIFYAWGEPKYIILMLITVIFSYISGLLIDFFNRKKKMVAKNIIFIISIIIVIGSLGYFKYSHFFVENINHIFSANISIKNIILPIGISFYTFQILSYIIDLYRQKITVQNNLFNLALYISFFPQLIAGPIVRYETVEEQLNNRKESVNKIIEGMERFLIGLGKKVIIANQMALVADAFYNSPVLNKYSLGVIVIGVLAYTFQIYFDFSGYSDMAIGLGKIFGFEFLDNFNYPYISKSVTEFWKRWHISLTTFFREYIYLPLGGNRVKKYRWIINMLIVWLLTGLWHGAAWNFILWGLYYYVLLILEKTVLKNVLKKMPKSFRLILTFALVNIGWMLFRINNLQDLKLILTHTSEVKVLDFIYNDPDLIMAIMLMPVAVFLSLNIMKKMDEKMRNNCLYNIVKKFSLIVIFVLCISFLASSVYNPFIYFRF